MRYSISRTALLLVAVAAVNLAGLQPATAGETTCYQPDGQIRGGAGDPTYIGQDIYNSTGVDQTKNRQVRPGDTDFFRVRIQNDSVDCTDSFTVMGDSSPSGYVVTYWSGMTNVTSQVLAGTFQTSSLDLGQSDVLRVRFVAKKSAEQGTVGKVMVTATSVGDGFTTDTVVAHETVQKGAGDAHATRRHT